MRLNKNILKALFLFLLIFGFSLNGFGQSDETEEIVVPEQAMEQVVRRILIWQFKPRKKPTTIYLAAEGIKQAWLPEIKNINFELLSDEEVEQAKDHYAFIILGKSENVFSVCFMSGNSGSGYEGYHWEFRILRQRVRLWQSGLCGSSGLDTGIPR